jgi:carbamoyltransferase
MKICVVNTTSHDSSICLLENDEIVYFIQEERLSRIKHDGFPIKSIFELQKYTNNVDYLVITGTMNISVSEIIHSFNKLYDIKEVYDFTTQHHFSHACTAFYNSGFDKSLNIVVDGAGSYLQDVEGWEESSIYYIEHPSTKELLYQKVMTRQDYQKQIKESILIDGKPGIVKMYEAITIYLGYNAIEAGKTMGLAAYGKKDINIPEFIINNTPNMSLFTQNYPSSSIINEEYLGLEHTVELERDLAYKIQETSEKVMYEFIKKAIELKLNCKNITISGGFGLNCVANYKYLKMFPDINFFIEPIANDPGTSLGIGKYIYYSELEKDKQYTIKPLKSLYLGGQYNPYDNEYVKNNSVKTTSTNVAKLLSEGKIIGIFQGKSEAGPRALGNRSMLMDPRIKDGKDIINKIKEREWFRPFAGTVLEEEAHNWFEMDRLESSPFMTYAIPVKKDLIPSITHVDGTCRIQTVNINQNYKYYELIREFYKLTNVPIVLNTSLNIKKLNRGDGFAKGQPIAETPENAIDILINSDLDYIYFADYDLLVK